MRADKIKSDEAQQRLFSALTQTMSSKQLRDATGLTMTQAHNALTLLLAEGLITRTGLTYRRKHMSDLLKAIDNIPQVPLELPNGYRVMGYTVSLLRVELPRAGYSGFPQNMDLGIFLLKEAGLIVTDVKHYSKVTAGVVFL